MKLHKIGGYNCQEVVYILPGALCLNINNHSFKLSRCIFKLSGY